jgi:hypothetical protein
VNYEDLMQGMQGMQGGARSAETNPLVDFRASRFLRTLKLASWASIVAGISVAVFGGYLIHPGLALIVAAYYAQSLSQGLVSAEAVQLRSEMDRHMQSSAMYKQAAESYLHAGGGKAVRES